MSSIIWYLGYAALSAGLWAASAFLLRWGHGGRMLAAVAVPALVAALAAFGGFLDAGAGWPLEWALIFVVYGLFSGGLAGIVALPIWFALEEWLGWRAR